MTKCFNSHAWVCIVTLLLLFDQTTACTEHKFKKVSGGLKHVSIGGDGTVWGVNSNDDIFRRDSNSWTHIGGKLKQISVGKTNHVWGVNSNDDIYYRNGNTWTNVGGKLKHVAVGVDGTVWGVNSNDDIFRRDGSSWTHIDGKLKQISVGNSDNVWGVNSNDDIFKRNGNSWTHIGGKLKYVSVSDDGAVWGVNSNDDIFYRNGDHWVSFCGKLKQISSGKGANHRRLLWGVNSGGDIYQWSDTESKNDAKAVIDGWFHSKKDRDWYQAGSNAHYKRYELKQIYCTTGAKECWHISLHVHPEQYKKHDRIYAFSYAGGLALRGHHENMGKWDYDLVKEEGLTRPSCTKYCKPYTGDSEKTIIIQHPGGMSLRVNPNDYDKINGFGGYGQYATWIAKPNHQQHYVRFQSTKSNKYLRIINNEVNVKGTGGKYTEFIPVHPNPIKPEIIALESKNYQNQYLCYNNNEFVVDTSPGSHCEFKMWKQ